MTSHITDFLIFLLIIAGGALASYAIMKFMLWIYPDEEDE